MSFKPGDLVVLIPSYAQGAWLWEHTNGSSLAQTKWEPGVIGLFICENAHDRFITYFILIEEKLCEMITGKSEYGFKPIFEKYVEPVII